uniref:Putative secreted protein n=1 Tax=Amblyomma cajennense TaxID=34607 RepID=A0A023FDZ8_AMBCJ
MRHPSQLRIWLGVLRQPWPTSAQNSACCLSESLHFPFAPLNAGMDTGGVWTPSCEHSVHVHLQCACAVLVLPLPCASAAVAHVLSCCPSWASNATCSLLQSMWKGFPYSLASHVGLSGTDDA